MLATVVSLALAAPLIPVSGGTDAAQAACKKARIAGKTRCLSTGRACRRSWEKQYNKHGYTCRRSAGGHYRLKRSLVF